MFRSDLVSEVFSVHVKKVLQVATKYGDQVGGLALAAVAVREPLFSCYGPYINDLHIRLSGGLRSIRQDAIFVKRSRARTGMLRKPKSRGVAHASAQFAPMILVISAGDIEHGTWSVGLKDLI